MGAVRFSIDPGLVRQLVSELPLKVFVETGTYEGASVRAVLPFFDEIHTIELSQELYRQAKEAFAEYPQVTVHHGRSEKVLRELAPRLRRRKTLFWLDAHWSEEPGSAGQGEKCPLPEELEAIGSVGASSVVMIDDARLFLSPPPPPADPDQWPDLRQVLAGLSSLSKRHEQMVIDDVIVLFPPKARNAVREYAQREATDWLAEVGRAREANLRLDEELGRRLGAIEHVIGALSEGSMAMQEAISQMRLVEARQEIRALERRMGDLASRLESVQRGMGDLSQGSRATQEAISEARGQTHQEIQVLAQGLEALGPELAGAFDQRLQRLEGGLQEVQGQRAHIEEIQRLVTILSDAELTRRQRRKAVRRVLTSPGRALAAVLAPPARLLLSPVWRRLKGRVNASRQHWRVRLSRLRIEPKLGQLEHHPPMELDIPKRYLNSKPPENPPSISIVTPSYNQVDFLERTIRSVLDQDYLRLEYIVQDGGSSDGTRELLERYAPKLAHWELRSDDGQAQAINLGFAHSSGEVMAYLNSDDLLLPGSLRYVGRYFESHPDVDVIYGHRVLIDEDDREIGRWVLPRHRDPILAWADYVPQETLFWRRKAWEAAGGRVDEEFRFAIDWDLLLRLRDAGTRIVRVPRFIGAFRVHGAQKTTAELDMTGAEEMTRIRSREHHRDVPAEEVSRELRGYLRRHVALHKLYRAGLIRY